MRARASHVTPYGKVASAWELKNDRFELMVEIPANAHATIRLPEATPDKVTESGKPLSMGDGVMGVNRDGDAVIVQVGSGRYTFVYAQATKMER